MGFEVPEAPPGSYCAVEVSYHETIDLDQEEQAALTALCRIFDQRDMPARREEVIHIWEKRLFDRGLQHLLPRRGGGWELPAVGSGYNPNDDREMRTIFECNIYNPYNQIIIGALTREIPATRFEPYDPDDDAGITTAENAEKMEEAIEKSNNMMAMLAEMSRFLCTDGRCVFFTRFERDAQRWGFVDEQEETAEEETVPETALEESESEDEGMEEQADSTVGGGSEEDGESSERSAEGGQEETRLPRGKEVIEAGGALEWKLPIKENCLANCNYAIRDREIDLGRARAKYPEVADKLNAEQGSPGGDDIDRLARVNVLLGVYDQFVTTDSQVYDVTEQIAWIRPAGLLEIEKPDVRESLLKKAGAIGLRVIHCGQVFCEARQISMDEQLTLVFAQPGDGMHRAGFTDWLIPIQKVLNNLMELANDYFVHGVPAKYMDDEIFDVQKLRDQVNMVGATYPFTREEGVSMDQAVWQETPPVFPPMLWEMIQDLKGQTAELLSGAFQALSGGGDSSSTDTFGGMLVQRDQALGRVGIPWRNIKEAISNVKRQAVMCLAHNGDKPVKMRKQDESITIQLEDLKGNFLAYPKTEESFPESHTAVQNRLTALWTDAASNPQVGEFLYNPDNLEVFMRTFGVKGFYLPQVAARDKQLGEVIELLAAEPIPNPQITQAKKLVAQLQAQLATDPSVAAQLKQTMTAIQGLAPEVSSVQIRQFDDDATELQTCVKILNSPRGRKLANGTAEEQAGYKNLELHASEHEARMKQKQASAQPQQKPVSRSLALKDLPPKPAAQLAQQAGLDASPQDFQEEEAAEAVSKHPGPGGITVQ